MYCLRCRKNTDDLNPTVVKTKNNRSMMKAKCSVCGGLKNKFVQNGGGLQDDQVYAKISDEAYKGKDKRAEEVNGYKLIESKKNFNVYKNDEGKVVVGNRGTSLKKNKAVGDLVEDALIVGKLDKFSKRQKKADKLVDKYVKEVGAENVTTTGHSLGGNKAINSAKKAGVKAVAFNAGSSPLDIKSGLTDRLTGKKNKNITHYTTGVDPISTGALASNYKQRLVKPTSKNVHSLDNFILDKKKK